MATKLSVPDYSHYNGNCGCCGKIIAQVRDTLPVPCLICEVTQYCRPACFMAHRRVHRAQCFANLDAEVDVSGASTLTAAQSLLDLRKYTLRWHDELGDAAIAAMNLHADPTAMRRFALVVHLSYVPWQPYRMRRFRLRYASVDPLASLGNTCISAALVRRQENEVVNQMNGMIGCVLIVLACQVPNVGFVFNSTFVGPEQSVLVDPPPRDWQGRLWDAVKRNEIP
ncbi:hypothetical protein K439DRAFT_1638686 [Ramaria rubella]|nr:hypothetical protein K439DRAFT_1638686 [Ramaria rubella]